MFRALLREILMIPISAMFATGLMLIASAVAPAQGTPVRDNGLNEPVYFVHGLDLRRVPSFNCRGWAAALNRYRALGATGRLHTVAFYTGDRNCNTRIGRYTAATGVRELGRRLAWEIYHRYSRRNIPVDAVGHAMGGLVIRAAITGVQRRTAGFPPLLYVEDVVTLSTPHLGTASTRACARGIRGRAQCRDMLPGSRFLRWLAADPQSTLGTDWTLIGAGDDDLVDWRSAVSSGGRRTAGYLSAGHKVVFANGQGLEHTTIDRAASGGYRSRYWNARDPGHWIQRRSGSAPLVASRNANFYWRLW